MKMFIYDTDGKKSLTATMTLIGFVIVMIKLLFNEVEIHIGESIYSFGQIDAATIAAVLTPILGSYTARRWKNDKKQNE